MKNTRARGARWALSFVLAAAVGALGCGSDNGDASADAAGSAADALRGPQIEVAGTWTSSFGEETITSASWASSMVTAAVVEFDNDGNFAITQNPADADYAPDGWDMMLAFPPLRRTRYISSTAP